MAAGCSSLSCSSVSKWPSGPKSGDRARSLQVCVCVHALGMCACR